MEEQDILTPESVSTDTARLLCEYCGGPKETEGRRRIKTRRFCSDLCRSRWHERRKAELHQRAVSLLTELGTVISELSTHRGRS